MTNKYLVFLFRVMKNIENDEQQTRCLWIPVEVGVNTTVSGRWRENGVWDTAEAGYDCDEQD